MTTTFAIGDVHGCLGKLDALLKACQCTASPALVVSQRDDVVRNLPRVHPDRDRAAAGRRGIAVLCRRARDNARRGRVVQELIGTLQRRSLRKSFTEKNNSCK
jgi:hypothetical protein